jgi:hypothetical protein
LSCSLASGGTTKTDAWLRHPKLEIAETEQQKEKRLEAATGRVMTRSDGGHLIPVSTIILLMKLTNSYSKLKYNK